MKNIVFLFFSLMSLIIQPLFSSAIDLKKIRETTGEMGPLGDGTSTCMHN